MRTRAGYAEEVKKEIVDVCKSIYEKKDFYDVTIKEISTKTRLSRPAIYDYFICKDEILLEILIEGFIDITKDLKAIKTDDKKEVVDHIALAFSLHMTLLRLVNKDLSEIEKNSRIERLVTLKSVYAEMVEVLEEIFAKVFDDKGGTIYFLAFVFGLYPFIKHTPKQLEAMKIAGIKTPDLSASELIAGYLKRYLS